jgi:hypothetical protein
MAGEPEPEAVRLKVYGAVPPEATKVRPPPRLELTLTG